MFTLLETEPKALYTLDKHWKTAIPASLFFFFLPRSLTKLPKLDLKFTLYLKQGLLLPEPLVF